VHDPRTAASGRQLKPYRAIENATLSEALFGLNYPAEHRTVARQPLVAAVGGQSVGQDPAARGAELSPSKHQEMAWPRPQGRTRGHRTVEGDEPASSLDGKSEEIDIGHLAWSMNAARVDASSVHEAHG
jgi:hypothetical protein